MHYEDYYCSFSRSFTRCPRSRRLLFSLPGTHQVREFITVFSPSKAIYYCISSLRRPLLSDSLLFSTAWRRIRTLLQNEATLWIMIQWWESEELWVLGVLYVVESHVVTRPVYLCLLLVVSEKWLSSPNPQIKVYPGEVEEIVGVSPFSCRKVYCSVKI